MSRRPQTPFSIRMSGRLRKRLDARSRQRGESKSRLAERLIDEGLRMEEHPGVVFRDGPAGRRPALTGGPDIWEVIETLKGTGLRGGKALEATAEWGNLDLGLVQVAASYYAAHPKEVDGWIEATHAEVRRARDAAERFEKLIA